MRGTKTQPNHEMAGSLKSRHLRRRRLRPFTSTRGLQQVNPTQPPRYSDRFDLSSRRSKGFVSLVNPELSGITSFFTKEVSENKSLKIGLGGIDNLWTRFRKEKPTNLFFFSRGALPFVWKTKKRQRIYPASSGARASPEVHPPLARIRGTIFIRARALAYKGRGCGTPDCWCTGLSK